MTPGPHPAAAQTWHKQTRYVTLIYMIQPTLRILADSGTPVMWMGTMHMLIGNALIGLLEGLLLAKIFKIKLQRAFGIMILANYFSAIVGWFGVKAAAATVFPWILGDEPLYHLQGLYSFMFGASFILTLLLEWPFCLAALRGKDRRIRKSVWGNLIVQSASYLLLLPWFFSYSHALGVLTPDHSLTAQLPYDATLFFVGRDNNMYRMGIDGHSRKKMMDMNDSHHWFPRMEYDKEHKWWNLSGNPSDSPVIPGIAENLFPDEDHPEFWEVDIFPYDRGADFRPAESRRWNLRASSWNIYAKDNQTSEELVIGADVPFLHWTVSSPTMLPGERAVFAMGGQIVLADMNTRRMCWLGEGDAPIAVPNRCLTAAATQPTPIAVHRPVPPRESYRLEEFELTAGLTEAELRAKVGEPNRVLPDPDIGDEGRWLVYDLDNRESLRLPFSSNNAPARKPHRLDEFELTGKLTEAALRAKVGGPDRILVLRNRDLGYEEPRLIYDLDTGGCLRLSFNTNPSEPFLLLADLTSPKGVIEKRIFRAHNWDR